MSGDQYDVPELPPFRGEEALLAVAAHGLLNPLAAIRGFAELLLERPDHFSPEQTRDLLLIIRDRAAFATDVLSDLVRGLPAPVSDALDGLKEETENRRGTR